jgi:NAD(P)-dependent dehydrogenase (short-subunit alcohol dehydrogenase family)
MVGLARALHAELRTELRAELRAELRDRGIHCYAVCPGFVDTDITRQAAARIAARGRIDAAEALRRLAAQNRIGRMHTADEVAAAVAMLVRERPAGCVYDLDHDPPRFVDEDQGP